MPVDVSAEVIANTPLSSDYNVLALAAPAIASSAQAGQFVMVKAGRGFDPLLRRPFSVFEVLRDARGRALGISLLNKRIGPSTGLVYDARPGDIVDCLGPLGRPFVVVEPPTEAFMVAGGVGLAPFAALTEQLRAREVRTTLFYGARRASELFYVDFFRNLASRSKSRPRTAASANGAASRRRSNAAWRRSIPTAKSSSTPAARKECCRHRAGRHEYERPCEVSVERIMGCGMGGCYSCVVPMKTEEGGFHHVRSCLAGPVLRGDQIVWE